MVLEITEPSLQSLRERKRPAKLLNENEASLYDEVSDVKTFYRRIYFGAIDTVTNCSKTRFSQTWYRAVKNIERLILNVINESEYQTQLEDVLSDYGDEINHCRLSAQLQILKTKFVESNEKTVSAPTNYMKNNTGVQTDFYSEIIVLLKLYLLPPSGWSASSMHCIKKWLRSTISQERLYHCMLLSIHKEKDFLQLNAWSVDIFRKATC